MDAIFVVVNSAGEKNNNLGGIKITYIFAIQMTVVKMASVCGCEGVYSRQGDFFIYKEYILLYLRTLVRHALSC